MRFDYEPEHRRKRLSTSTVNCLRTGAKQIAPVKRTHGPRDPLQTDVM
jgi:hypothetical protein